MSIYSDTTVRYCTNLRFEKNLQVHPKVSSQDADEAYD